MSSVLKVNMMKFNIRCTLESQASGSMNSLLFFNAQRSISPQKERGTMQRQPSRDEFRSYPICPKFCFTRMPSRSKLWSSRKANVPKRRLFCSSCPSHVSEIQQKIFHLRLEKVQRLCLHFSASGKPQSKQQSQCACSKQRFPRFCTCICLSTVDRMNSHDLGSEGATDLRSLTHCNIFYETHVSRRKTGERDYYDG